MRVEHLAEGVTLFNADCREVRPEPPHRGGDTQVEAATRIRKSVGNLERMVLDALQTYGPATNDELVKHTGISLQTICARVWTLRKHLGLIEDSGLRRPSSKGRAAIVWQKIPTPGRG